MTRMNQALWGSTCLVTLALLASTDPAVSADLTATYMESGTYDAAAKQLATQFEKDTGTAVAIVAFPWAVLRQNNTTDLITESGQYQVMSGGYYLADLYGYFAPLDEYVARDDYAEGMIPGLMEPGRSEWYQGHQIGVPYGIDSYGLIVNDEILAAAGVSPDLASWDDVIGACETIEAAVPDVACLAHPTGNPEQIGAFFFSAYEGTFIDADGNYALEAEAATNAAALLPPLWSHLPEGGQALTFDEVQTLFADGGAAMMVNWPSFVTNALNDPGASKVAGKWRQVAFPGGGFPWLSLWQQFVPTSTADKDTAWAWIKTFAGPEHAKSNYVEHNINPVWLAVYEDPELAQAHAHHWPVMLEDFKRAKNPPLSGEAQDFLTNTLVEVATGQIEPAAAIEKVNGAWATIPVPEALLEAAAGARLQAK